MQSIKASIRRRLNLHDNNANLDEAEELDEETAGHLQKQIQEAEEEGEKYPHGKPGSFLNRLIMHGNKKTEDEMAAAFIAESKAHTAAEHEASAGATK